MAKVLRVEHIIFLEYEVLKGNWKNYPTSMVKHKRWDNLQLEKKTIFLSEQERYWKHNCLSLRSCSFFGSSSFLAAGSLALSIRPDVAVILS